MNEFSKIVLINKDDILIKVNTPKVETKTKSGIVLADGTVRDTAKRGKTYEVAQLADTYVGNLKVGLMIEPKADARPKVPQWLKSNANFRHALNTMGEASTDDADYLIINASAVKCAYEKE